MFGSAQNSITSPGDEKVEYAGVTDQFFATVVRAKDPAISSVWAGQA